VLVGEAGDRHSASERADRHRARRPAARDRLLARPARHPRRGVGGGPGSAVLRSPARPACAAP